MTCESCHYWLKPESKIILGGTALGVCRRFPPTMTLLPTSRGPALETIWPQTAPKDTCGELKLKVITA